MSDLSNHVIMAITVNSLGIAKAGFGVPLYASGSAAWAERVRSYTSLAGVAADFATTSPEYRWAQATLGQTPHPTTIKIGRLALPPTTVYKFTPTAIDSHDYVITVEGEGVTTTTVTYTSDATATVAEICTGLETLLSAVVGNNYVVADNTTDITLTADAAGDWFTVSLGDIGDGHIELTHVDSGIATDIAAIVNEDDDWYALYTASSFNSPAYVLAAVADIEARKKIYLAEVSDSETVTTAVTNGDVLDTINTAARARTAGCYHKDPASFFGGGWLGRMLPTDPGSASWKFKQLSGPAYDTLTSTQRTNLLAREANGIERFGGRNITYEGTTADGDFIDVQRGLDWLEDLIQVEVATALVTEDKVPYTDEGIGVIENAVRGALDVAVQQGVLASSPAPVVTVPKVADVLAADKAARVLDGVVFSGTLAGAIHKVNIDGVVSV